jgi:GTP-binding protein
LTDADEVANRLTADIGREVLLISAVTGQGLSKLVGQVAQMLAEIKREEAEAEARRKPIEFPTEAAVRTDDFKTAPIASITPPDAEG